MNPVEQLIDLGHLTESAAREVEQTVAETGRSYEEVLLQHGASTDAVRASIAKYYDVPAHTYDDTTSIPHEVLNFIPEESATHYRIVPLYLRR